MADIPLTELIKRYYGGRQEYMADLPAYSMLRGKNCRFSWRELARMRDPPAANPFIDLPESAIINARFVVSRLFNAAPEDVKVVELAEMHSGKTMPVRITADVGGVTKICYAKVPDASRFLTLELYNILSGSKPLDFIFNDRVYVDEQAPGKLLADWDLDVLLGMRAYLENRIRLDSVCSVLGINDLRSNPGNTAVDLDGSIFLFDLDEGLKYRLESLVDGLPVEHGHILAIQHDERQLIARRALKDIDRVRTLIGLMRDYDFNASEALQYQIPDADNMGDVVAHSLMYIGVLVDDPSY